jgi:hypothetical protein
VLSRLSFLENWIKSVNSFSLLYLLFYLSTLVDTNTPSKIWLQ